MDNAKLEIPKELLEHFPEAESWTDQEKRVILIAFLAGQMDGDEKATEANRELIAQQLADHSTPAGSVLSAGSLLAQRPAIEPADQPDHTGD